jgi:hypothetical protein
MSASYVPYLIAKFATGLDRAVQPWLLPDDAQDSLFDGFVYRGVWNKRPGYDQFATGQEGGSTYTESRIIVTVTMEAYGTGSGVAGPYTHTAANIPLSRGSITITAGGQSATDDGNGVFVTTPAGGTGTVNYTTGQMSVTFNGVVAGATPITVTYDYFPGLPVMMVANFYTSSNIRQLIVADTRNVNRFNPTTNRFVYLSHSTAFTGDSSNFFTWVNYEDAASATPAPRLLFTNSIDTIQQYDGTNITDYVFTLTGVTALSALLMFQMKDRLILLRTREDGTVYGKRIRISGTGADCDNFNPSATGAGVIDIPDASWIFAAAFNRDDLIIFTENSTWILQFTGNDVVPFQLNRLDSSRGSGAPYSGITYLNRTTTASARGFITSDGYRVERYDDRIPDYSFNEIDQTNFKLCFAGSVDEDRDHYLIHPSPQQSASDRILVTNYEEDNFCVYRIALSCMGNFIEAYDTTWNDLLSFSNWDEMAERFGNWDAFSYTKGLPFAIGGGHNGQIWRLNVNGIEDNPVRIRNLTVINAFTLQVETDFNNFVVGDYIFINGISGMAEANDKQGAIKTIISANRIFQLDMPTSRFSAYTSGGFASRVIPFESTTKKFNPFAQNAQKVRCGYFYMYVSASNTGLTRNIDLVNITQANPAVVTANNNGFKDGQIITIYGAGGMTEINGQASQITVIDQNTFAMTQIDSTAYTAYTSGGVAAGPEECFIDIEVITNDEPDVTQVEDASLITYAKPYRINCTPDRRDEGTKRWVKIFINQTARFVQFKLTNTQALSVIQIQAMMPGFIGVGRLI